MKEIKFLFVFLFLSSLIFAQIEVVVTADKDVYGYIYSKENISVTGYKTI